MKGNRMNLVWGIVLIIAGGLFLTQSLGWMEDLPVTTWVIIFAVGSLLFFGTYFASGLQWGWLFPAFIFAGVAVTLYMVTAGVEDAVVGAPVLVGVGLPFLVAFIQDRRRNWWALIPMWVMTVLVLVILFVDRVSGEVIGAFFLFSVGLPFLVVYAIDRSRKWALIPAFILIVLGIIPLLAVNTDGNAIGAFFLFAISLPFFVIYFWNQRSWWAIIPAGILATLGLVVLMIRQEELNPMGGGGDWVGSILFFGIAVTFGVLWLRQKSAPTGWAKYPAIILALIGVITLFFGEGAQQYLFGAIIVALGLWILYTNLRKPLPENTAETILPTSEMDSDESAN